MKGEIWYENGKRRATPEYNCWQHMKNRCLNPLAKDFKYYGGRGIKLASRWLVYENFLSDMGRKPNRKFTLERKNTNGPYSKRNCQWATRQTQAQNRNYCTMNIARARAIRLEYAKGKLTQKQIAEKYQSTQAHVSQITRGSAWKNAGGPILRGSRGGQPCVL